MSNKIPAIVFFFGVLLSINSNCSKADKKSDPVPGGPEISWWLTKSDQSVLLKKQSTKFSFNAAANSNPTIEIDSAQALQTVDGFGYTLTGGSAYLINKLSTAQKASLLQELF